MKPQVRTYMCEGCRDNYCVNCGHVLFSEDIVCALCGTKISEKFLKVE